MWRNDQNTFNDFSSHQSPIPLISPRNNLQQIRLLTILLLKEWRGYIVMMNYRSDLATLLFLHCHHNKESQQAWQG